MRGGQQIDGFGRPVPDHIDDDQRRQRAAVEAQRQQPGGHRQQRGENQHMAAVGPVRQPAERHLQYQRAHRHGGQEQRHVVLAVALGCGVDRREAGDGHGKAAHRQHSGHADGRDAPGFGQRHACRRRRRRLGQPCQPHRQDGQRREGDADQRRRGGPDVHQHQRVVADAEPGDVGHRGQRHDPAAYGVVDHVVQPALRNHEEPAYGKAVEGARRYPQRRVQPGADGHVGQRDQRRQHHEDPGMADAAHQRPDEQAAGQAAGR